MTDLLTSEQVAEFREAFNVFDQSGTGHISSLDLKVLIAALGQNPPESELNSVISIADTKHGGQIDFQFFLNTLSKWVGQADNEEEIVDAFRIFDRENTGYISQDEFRHIMTNLGDKMPDQEVNEMISAAKVGPGDPIHYESFVKSLMSK